MAPPRTPWTPARRSTWCRRRAVIHRWRLPAVICTRGRKTARQGFCRREPTTASSSLLQIINTEAGRAAALADHHARIGKLEEERRDMVTEIREFRKEMGAFRKETSDRGFQL